MSRKKNKKSIYKYIYCDVYRRGVLVFIGSCEDLCDTAKDLYEDDKQLINTLHESCNDEIYKSTDVAGRCYDSEAGSIIVHLQTFSFDFNPLQIGTLSHELLHAAFLLLDFIGIEYKYGGNNEAYTYLHEYLLREALELEGYVSVEEQK